MQHLNPLTEDPEKDHEGQILGRRELFRTVFFLTAHIRVESLSVIVFVPG
ncbi:hypothetical protein LptCag_0322 [Leptospirillum ferriphilum]|uniref:Uncharacterized protein n=1 Tax=Leptospirillum ferriphilum TaxID=178606 RepID=A0A094YJ99_9BACT|nr:hypothetical protein LptCag_0322 [Leptospirillum ferriphilum]